MTERKICEVKLEKKKDSKIIIRNNLYSNKIGIYWVGN